MPQDHPSRNPLAPLLRRATTLAKIAINGASGNGSNAGSAIVATSITPDTDVVPPPYFQHSFMIGVDAIGDPEAAFFADGKRYDFTD